MNLLTEFSSARPPSHLWKILGIGVLQLTINLELRYIYSLCKNIRSNFSLDILSYIHDTAIPTYMWNI